MSDSTSRKQWWLVLRRTGYRTIAIKLAINWVPDGTEFDRLVDPKPNTDDWEFYDKASDVAGVPDDLKVRYELVAVTQPFESTSVEIG